MTTTCPSCAEPLPESASPIERCPACGERLGAKPDDVPPAGMPRPAIFAVLLGTTYVGLGACCGLVTVTNAANARGVSRGAELIVLAIAGAASMLHVAAGLGLVLRQESGRIAALTCAIIDVLLGAFLVGSSVMTSRQTTTAPDSMVEIQAFMQGLTGSTLVVPSVIAIMFLRRATTRDAIAASRGAPDPGRA